MNPFTLESYLPRKYKKHSKEMIKHLADMYLTWTENYLSEKENEKIKKLQVYKNINSFLKKNFNIKLKQLKTSIDVVFNKISLYGIKYLYDQLIILLTEVVGDDLFIWK